MANLKIWVFGICLVLIVLIVLLIILPFEKSLENEIYYGIHLMILVFYVGVTYYLVNTNEKLVSTHKENLCLQNTPIVTAVLRSQSELLRQVQLEQGREIIQGEEPDIENINKTKLMLHNPSQNNAMDVRVILTAYVNERRINSSPPLDGSRDWHVQAGHHVVKVFKMEEDYLSSANCTIQSMAEETTEANKAKQLVLEIKLSYSDGCGRPIDNPPLSWYFDFKEMRWQFVI